MDNRTNTIAGWVLASLGAALALSIVAHGMFAQERPEKMGYPIEGVQETGGAGGAPQEVPIATRLAKADTSKGQQIFQKCAACHTIAQGAPNGIGPNLYATVGEAVAQGKNGFAFSDALKGVGGSWTFDKLDQWLTSPRKFANGTKMTFAGLSDGQDRADVIAYLNAQGSNVPLPAPPKESADKGAGKADAAAASAGNAAAPTNQAASANASAPAKQGS